MTYFIYLQLIRFNTFFIHIQYDVFYFYKKLNDIRKAQKEALSWYNGVYKERDRPKKYKTKKSNEEINIKNINHLNVYEAKHGETNRI